MVLPSAKTIYICNIKELAVKMCFVQQVEEMKTKTSNPKVKYVNIYKYDSN